MSDNINETAPFSDTTIIIPPKVPAIPISVHFEFGALTDTGKVRSKNEDQYLIARASKSLDVLGTSLTEDQRTPLIQSESFILLVADGIGGRAGGELASAFVVNEAIRHIMETAKWFFRLDDPDEDVRIRLLQETLDRADRKLRDEAEEDPTLKGMGTTLTAVSMIGADAFLVHVGDSRAYLLRDGVLQQLTTDHTLVREMVQKGIITPEVARTHHLRHVITNVIGGPAGVSGEMADFRLKDGDRLLLCSDGLTEPVRDEQIREILTGYSHPQEACDGLVAAALAGGGPDNVTVVVAACSIEGEEQTQASDD
jgi:PPM family protein phosphatase